MAELIGCRECDSPSCKGCNIKILADMLKLGKLNALMNKNRCIDGSVDAAPVVHGEWVYDHWCEFKCLNCGHWSDSKPYKGRENYCPYCGAKMDGGKKE